MMEAGRPQAPSVAGRVQSFHYHLLRVATARYGRDPVRLAADELAEAVRQAERSLALEELVLASGEAVGVVIAPGQVDAALASIAARYADAAEMVEDLAQNGLDEAALRVALWRELVFDAVLQRVAARHAAITDEEIELAYRRAPQALARPERRTASHILITINEGHAENRRAAATERIRALAAVLSTRPEVFEALARRHSECPTALEGGRLGTVARGRLYPQLDAALFAQAPGTVSEPIETEIGWHLLRCERILPAHQPSLEEAREPLRRRLTARRRREAQRDWLAALQRAEAISVDEDSV